MSGSWKCQCWCVFNVVYLNRPSLHDNRWTFPLPDKLKRKGVAQSWEWVGWLYSVSLLLQWLSQHPASNVCLSVCVCFVLFFFLYLFCCSGGWCTLRGRLSPVGLSNARAFSSSEPCLLTTAQTSHGAPYWTAPLSR